MFQPQRNLIQGEPSEQKFKDDQLEKTNELPEFGKELKRRNSNNAIY